MSKPFYLLFTEPALAAVCVYLSFLYALIYGLFGVFPIIYREIRGFSEEQFALTYLSLGLGFLIGAAVSYFFACLYSAEGWNRSSSGRTIGLTLQLFESMHRNLHLRMLDSLECIGYATVVLSNPI